MENYIHIIWFLLLGIFLAGYAILDGFDLAPISQESRH